MMFFRSFGGGIEIRGGGGTAPIVDDYDDNPHHHHHHHHHQRMAGSLITKQHPQQHDDHHRALPLRQQQQHQQKLECYSDEVDSRSGDGGAADSEPRRPKRQRKSTAKAAAAASQQGAKAMGGRGAEDGSAVEAVRRPRGRPPGSKNKPKPPIVITRDAEDPSSPAAMRPHVLEVSPGQDLVDALASFSRRRNLGLCVLAGTGRVSNVVFRHPSASTSPPGSADLSFPGHFDILSISATFLPRSIAPSLPTSPPEGGGEVSVSLAGPQGQVFGGLVVRPLTAAGTVTILAAAFCNPTYHLLPAEDEVSVSVSVSGGGGDVEAARAHAPQASPHQRLQHINTPSQRQQHPEQQQPPYRQQRRSTSPPSSSSAAAGAQHNQPAVTLAAAELCGMSIYCCHLPSDVIWTPAARSDY